MTNPESHRAAFEAWYARDFEPKLGPNRSMEFTIKEVLRVGWLAAKSEPLAVTPEMVSVPSEMTDEMRRAIWLEQARDSAERVPASEATIQEFVRRMMADDDQAKTDRRAYRAMVTAALNHGRE